MANTTRQDLLSRLGAAFAKAAQNGSSLTAQEVQDWERLYHLYNDLIYKYVGRFGLSGAQADDIVSVVWSEVETRLPRFRHQGAKGSFRRWLYLIVQSRATDAMRRKSKNKRGRTSILDGKAESRADPEAEFRREVVELTLKQYRSLAPTAEREIFERCFVDGESRVDMARSLSMKPDAVRASVSRGLSRFRQISESIIGEKLDDLQREDS